jgi:hypothetical protein
MNKVINVTPLPQGHLHIEMADGRKGNFDVTPYMESAFFSTLKNEEYFKQVKTFFSGIGWPEGQDLGPDTISAELSDELESA